MRVTFAHLCDYAMVSKDGKLSVMGIFSIINADQLPFRLAQAYLAFEVEGNHLEVGRDHSIEIHLVDSDGNKLFELKGHGAAVQPGKNLPAGDHRKQAQVLRIQDLVFVRAGAHEINIFLNGVLQDSQTIKFVVHAPPPAPPQIPGQRPPARG